MSSTNATDERGFPLLAPHRLTPTERLHEVTMAALTRASSPPEHSVAISRNAKGVAQFEVTVRGYVIEDVLEQAWSVFAGLEVRLPYPSNGSET